MADANSEAARSLASASASGAQPGALRATFATLPLELKARIVQLAAWQDERHRARWVPGARGEKLVEVHLKNVWRGRSLVALSETSKVLNDLAAVHLFNAISGTKPDTPFFTFRILHRHARHFRSATFESVDDAPSLTITLPRVLAALPLFSSITHLRIDRATATRVLGPIDQLVPLHEVGYDDLALHRAAFRSLARNLLSLDLAGIWSPLDVYVMMCGSPEIRRIKVSAEDGQVGAALASRADSSVPTTLRHLTLDGTSSTTNEFDPLWHAPEWIVKLESLELVNLHLDNDAVAFITIHASSLRHLSISLPSSPFAQQQFNSPDLFADMHFPLLTSFTLLNAQPDAFQPIITSLAAATTSTLPPSDTPTSPFSTITRLAVELTGPGDALFRQEWLALLKPFRQASPGGVHFAAPGWHLGLAADYFRPIQLASTCERADTFLQRNTDVKQLNQGRIGSAVPRRVARRVAAIRAALDHGGEMLDERASQGDFDGLEVMMESLGSIWGDKLLRDD